MFIEWQKQHYLEALLGYHMWVILEILENFFNLSLSTDNYSSFERQLLILKTWKWMSFKCYNMAWVVYYEMEIIWPNES